MYEMNVNELLAPFQELLLSLQETLIESTAGSRVISDNGFLYLGYLDDNSNVTSYSCIMPDIINVSNPNDTTVFVEFADGTKEIARLNDGDTFNLETGVLICIFKKILCEMGIGCTGSSAYNKIIKYALTKLDATKKGRKQSKSVW